MSGTLVPIAAAAILALSCLGAACRTSAPEGLEPEAAHAKPPEPTLDEVNTRWRDVRCRLAEAIEMRKDAGDGWKGTGGVLVAKTGDSDAFYYQLLVSDRQTLDDLFDGNVLRAGTAFVCEGWKLKKANGKGPYLELRFADRPARARVEFRGVRQFDFDGFPVSRVAQVEDYCRGTLFKVSAPNGGETAAPPAAPATAAPEAPPAAPAVAPAPTRPAPVESSVRPPEREKPLLEIVRAAVVPNPVPRNGDAELLVEYRVGGLAVAASVTVLERREVWKGQQSIVSAEDRYERPAATFTSSKPLKFSSDAAPGVYQLRVRLEAGGASAERSVAFELR
jgi:hypothetical protein